MKMNLEFEMRTVALQAAVQIYQGQGEGASNQRRIVSLANYFLEFLEGNL